MNVVTRCENKKFVVERFKSSALQMRINAEQETSFRTMYERIAVFAHVDTCTFEHRHPEWKMCRTRFCQYNFRGMRIIRQKIHDTEKMGWEYYSTDWTCLCGQLWLPYCHHEWVVIEFQTRDTEGKKHVCVYDWKTKIGFNRTHSHTHTRSTPDYSEIMTHTHKSGTQKRCSIP
jgi:hypothetical protein